MRISGEGQDSEALLRETLAQTPEAIGARLKLVAALMQRDRTIEALDKMSPDALPEHQIIAHYDLAKLWSSAGLYRRHAALWHHAHRADPGLTSYRVRGG
jgi:hypothetical protein